MHVTARAATAAMALLAIGCGDVCNGIAGTCVALTVDGQGQVDGIELTLSGAVTGRRVGPATATVQDLPVDIALQLTATTSSNLHIDASGVLLGRIVGEGSINVVLTGSHGTAHLRLGAAPPLDLAGTAYDLTPPCVTVCGGDLGQSSCWTTAVDCNTVQRCGTSLRACDAPTDMGAFSGHCGSDRNLYCCPSQYPVFCNTVAGNCGHCWSSGTNCGSPMVSCNDNLCHSCSNGHTYSCSTMSCP
jgi:hypothetical protein